MKFLFRKKYTVFTVCAAVLGMILRARQYLAAVSLQQDEVRIAMDVLPHQSFVELFNHIGSQPQPLGFYVLLKFMTDGLGPDELVLRLVPFICGLLSVVLFVMLSKRLLNDLSWSISVFLFAISPLLIYQSANTKQYSLEVLGTIVLLMMIVDMDRCSMGMGRPLLYGAAGAVVLWFSNTGRSSITDFDSVKLRILER